MEGPLTCLFAKAPVAGRVKTRLAVAVGGRSAAVVAAAMLEDALALLRARGRPFAVATPDVGLMRDAGGEMVRYVQYVGALPDAWDPPPCVDQGAGTLDERLERVLGAAAPAVALGADTIGLHPALLDAADRAVRAGRAVLGPASDGGFWLMGLPRCPGGLLRQVRWSHPSTFLDTHRALLEAGFDVDLLDELSDLDTWDDLCAVPARDDLEVWQPRLLSIARQLVGVSPA